ncbi:hypothetical protein JXQ70_08150 [bacterium]|nr:hypothetical protein [bacterium]
MTNPDLLKAIGASWRLLFFLLLQCDIGTKSFSAGSQPLAEALGVTVSTLSAWMQRLESLKVITVKSNADKLRLALLPPFSQIILVTEEGIEPDQSSEPKREREFDESTTDIILKRRSRALTKVEDDIDFVFNKLLSFDLRLSALERVYQETHKSQQKNKKIPDQIPPGE